MKRAMSIIAMFICLALLVPAFAEPVLVNEDIGTLSVIYGTSVFRASGVEGFGLADMNGNLLTEQIYAGFSEEYGYITANSLDIEGRNAFGMFDSTGAILIPFEYGHIEMLNAKWAIAYVLDAGSPAQYDMATYDDEYFVINRVDIYHMPEGAKLAELSRDEFLEADHVGNGINIQDRTTGAITTYDETFTALGTVDSIYSDDLAPMDYYEFRENGQYGIKDAAGNVVMAPSYQYVNLYAASYGDYAMVSTGDKYGLVKPSTGEVLLPAEYDYIRTMYNIPNPASFDSDYEAFGYYCVEVDDKVGYARAGGEVTCQPKYSDSVVSVNGISMLLTDLTGNKIIVAADGVETAVEGYESIYALDFCSGVYYEVSDADYNSGIIDWHGNVIFPCEYSAIDVTSDGQYVVLTKDYDTYSLYRLPYFGENTDEQPVIEENPAVDEQPVIDEQPANTGNAGFAIGGGLGGNNAGASANEELPEETVVEEVPSEETVEEVAPPAAETDYSMVNSLLSSARILITTDAAANGAAAATIIQNAIGQLADRPDVTGMLNSAVILLGTDSAANGTAAIALIDSALTLLQ